MPRRALASEHKAELKEGLALRDYLRSAERRAMGTMGPPSLTREFPWARVGA